MLRNFLLAGLLIVLASPALGQQTASLVAVPYDRAEALGVNIALLDSAHLSAAHVDPTKSAFPERQGEFFEAWKDYLADLSDHLEANGFMWEQPLRGSFRFYFRSSGHPEVVTYRVASLEGERGEMFGKLLDSFVRSSQIDMSASVPFAQCGPVTLMPPSD